MTSSHDRPPAAWVELTVDQLLRRSAAHTVAQLADALLARNLQGTAALRRSWTATVDALRCALDAESMRAWTVLLEYPLLRVRRRADVLILTPKAIFVLEFKTGLTQAAPQASRQADDYAQDLHDFHAGCRGVPIVPMAVRTSATAIANDPVLIWHGVAPVQHVQTGRLGTVLADIYAAIPARSNPIDPAWWLAQPYKPVPSIVEAARMAFARQAVPDIDAARAEPVGLRRTTTAILAHIASAKAASEHLVVFVTGIPGAGKTRCGLAVAFEAAEADRGVYLTGNPTLVHVFREALAQDAIAGGMQAALARQRMEARIQALPDFRDHYVSRSDVPDEHVIVIDEAQRSWARDHAVRKTQTRNVSLTDSEPAHILDAMARHSDWAVVVCLVGGGQEIHDGEGGLAEWAAAIAARPTWRCAAPPHAEKATDPRQRITLRQRDRADEALHLAVPVRALRGPTVADWVDKVLRNDRAGASALATAHDFPVLVTRDLASLRQALRARARGLRRAGLVASAGAKRLRADGLGVELPHMDRAAVARWFLDHWPDDVRASDALEVVATEFSCQGLELDYVGLAWGGDLVRRDGQWLVRFFHGKNWRNRDPASEAWSNQVNTYRVLLTRARYETVIWVPRGSRAGTPFHDTTRDAAELDAIADFLLACGARPLADAPQPVSEPAPTLL